MNRTKLATIGLGLVAAAFLLLTGGKADDKQEGIVAYGEQAERTETDSGEVLFRSASVGEKDSETVIVAENGSLSLHMGKSTGLVHLTGQGGVQWFGYPPDGSSVQAHQETMVYAPFLLRYTSGNGVSAAFPGKEEGQLTVMAIPGGARAVYELTELDMTVTLEYRLTADGMEASIPFAGLKEGTKNKFVSIELLPYMEAATPAEEGYLFIPDGSGALISFMEQRASSSDRYAQSIYGGDPAFRTQLYERPAKEKRESVLPGPQEHIALPVFGLTRASRGFAAIVTAGEEDARIVASPGGYQNVALYRVAAELLYRHEDLVHIGASGEIPILQGEMIPGDRSVRYVLLDREQADYAGMAHAYRRYLLDVAGVKPVPEQESVLRVRLIGGVKRDEILGSTFQVMTRFEEAEAIVEALLQQGVKLELVYEGWSSGGLLGRQPQHFPVEKKLGGERALQGLLSYAEARGVPVYLNANYVKPFARYAKVKEGREAIRGMDKEVLPVYAPNPATLQPDMAEKHYLLKPGVALTRFQKELAQWKELNAGGVKLDGIGNMLYSDQDARGQQPRGEVKRDWQAIMKQAASELGSVAVDYGFAYTLGYAERIDGAPLGSSGYTVEDQEVPFYQIALKGIIPLSGAPLNLSDTPRLDLLKSVEYGMLPSFLLTEQPSAMLKRTPLDHIFSSRFQDWRDELAAVYEEASAVLDEVAGAAIVSHREVQPGLFETAYDNGKRIVVNYGGENVTIAGQLIEPMSFAWREGDRR